MAKKEDSVQIEDLLKTNQRLSEQVKNLTGRNEELLETVRELEKNNLKLQKGDKKSVKKKGITVLYVEFEGFKDIKETSAADNIYDALDEIYIHFDEIADKHKLERIKWIGDDYVCAGGIVEKRSTNPIDIALAALEINDYVLQLRDKYEKEGKQFWNLKIGIHSGNGIVEAKKHKSKKTTYILNGEVINTIPRIASMCEDGEIYLSDYTYEIIKGYFSCEYSGDLPVKYRGNLELYRLKRIKKVYSEDRKAGLVPNAEFTLKYHLKEFNDLEEKVLTFFCRRICLKTCTTTIIRIRLMLSIKQS